MIKTRKKGFTLVELVIVIITVCVLSAIAAPMMSGNFRRSKLSEAMAGANAIRTAERLYCNEYGAAIPIIGGDFSGSPLNSHISSSDLNGTYFKSSKYAAYNMGGGKFLITVDTSAYMGPGSWITMDQDGNYTGY